MCRLYLITFVGDAEVVSEQRVSEISSQTNEMSLSLDALDAQTNNVIKDTLDFEPSRQSGQRVAVRNNLAHGRRSAVKCGPGRRRKTQSLTSQYHICSECGRQFTHRQLLVTHLVTHSGERPFACRIPGCDKRFGQSSTRNYHERIHSDARPYVCSQCGLGFKLAPVLRIHMIRMHGSGESQHSCDQCGRQFKLIGGLRTHVRTVHSEDRPHACAVCPKRFKSRQQLVRHTRDMHCAEKPLHCPVCDRTFTQACNMRTHMRTHTGERPYICDICGVRFSHSGSLKGHRLTHHKAATVHCVAKTECDTVVNVPDWMTLGAFVSTV